MSNRGTTEKQVQKQPTAAEAHAGEVAQLYREGHGRNEIARRLKLNPRTVTDAARIAGVSFDQAPTRAANAAAAELAKARLVGTRRQLGAVADLALGRLIELLEDNTVDLDARTLAVVTGVVLDKLAQMPEPKTDPDPIIQDAAYW